LIDREVLIAYLKLSKHKSVGVREFQRLMKYKSPGKAKWMLEKLVKLGLVERCEESIYRVKKELPFPLSTYIVLRGMLLPRISPITLFATVFVLTYAVLVTVPIETLIAFMIIIAPYWMETLRTIKQLREQIKSSS